MACDLYYVPRTRATRPRWLLEELGVPYNLVRLDVSTAGNRSPEYLKLNPFGRVPTLVDDGTVIYESAAICLYLADKHIDKGLAPPFGSPLRAPYYQWMVYAMATLDAALSGFDGTEATRAPVLEAVTVLEDAIGDHEFLVDDRFSAADVMIGSLYGWAKSLKLLDPERRISQYGKRLTARPAFRASIAD